MALVGALCAGVHVITGFTNRSLRARVATLLGVPYSMGQMSYDLRRLRLKGLITRLPRSNTYVLTPDGQRVAIFYTKLHNRLLRPLAAIRPRDDREEEDVGAAGQHFVRIEGEARDVHLGLVDSEEMLRGDPPAERAAPGQRQESAAEGVETSAEPLLPLRSHGARRAAPPAGFPVEVLTAEGDLLTLPHRHGCDGFYAARLVR